MGGPFVGWSSWAPCASWFARDADRYSGPWNRITKDPILVIGTTFDPATPYINARRVANLLGSAILLTHKGYGHTSEADPSQCVDKATSTYLVDLVTPRKGTICHSDRQPFDPQFGETATAPGRPVRQSLTITSRACSADGTRGAGESGKGALRGSP